MIRSWRNIVLVLSVVSVFVAVNSLSAAGEGKADASGKKAKNTAKRTSSILKKYPDADVNGDGNLSREEFKAFMDKRRAVRDKDLLAIHPELDTDGDGKLNKEERQAGQEKISAYHQSKMAEKVMADHPKADTDGDGKLSKEEMKAFRKSQAKSRATNLTPTQVIDWMVKNFAKIDSDGSGELSKKELQVVKKKFERRGLGGGHGKAAGKDPHGKKDKGMKGHKGEQKPKMEGS